jgi:hypothetical protein
MKFVVKFFIILVLFLLTNCAYNEGVIQKDNTSYLKLTGDTKNISLQIDDGKEIQLTEILDNTVYEIEPGTHVITVRRNSEIIVQRKLYFDNQITKEVKVK